MTLLRTLRPGEYSVYVDLEMRRVDFAIWFERSVIQSDHTLQDHRSKLRPRLWK